MPLQFCSLTCPLANRKTFSPLNRGNASAMKGGNTWTVFYSIFQSPQSGQCLCNLVLPKASRAFIVFQSPQSGQCLCNSPNNTVQVSLDNLSVPSIGAMPLQSSLAMIGQSFWWTFSPLNRGNASAIIPAKTSSKCWSTFQSPQSGQCLCNRWS